MDVVPHHFAGDLLDRGVGPAGHHLVDHGVADFEILEPLAKTAELRFGRMLKTVGLQCPSRVFGNLLVERLHQDFYPGDIAAAKHADQPAVVDDRQAADPMLDQQPFGLFELLGGVGRDQGSAHDVRGNDTGSLAVHGGLLLGKKTVLDRSC